MRPLSTIAVSTYSFGPDARARDGLDFAQWLDTLRTYPFACLMETRNDADPEGNVLRSRDLPKELLGDTAR